MTREEYAGGADRPKQKPINLDVHGYFWTSQHPVPPSLAS